jgi:hypothetical protein
MLIDRTLRQNQFPSDHNPVLPVEAFDSLILQIQEVRRHRTDHED